MKPATIQQRIATWKKRRFGKDTASQRDRAMRHPLTADYKAALGSPLFPFNCPDPDGRARFELLMIVKKQPIPDIIAIPLKNVEATVLVIDDQIGFIRYRIEVPQANWCCRFNTDLKQLCTVLNASVLLSQ